jgi:hypothetical protein
MINIIKQQGANPDTATIAAEGLTSERQAHSKMVELLLNTGQAVWELHSGKVFSKDKTGGPDKCIYSPGQSTAHVGGISGISFYIVTE